MCGITGFLHFDPAQPADKYLIKDMTNILSHRGPDGEGQFVEGNVALGHRRLSIIDLETGEQPMFSFDRSKVIVFNGEIYNYIELRDALCKKNHVFRTESDTEVILAAYSEWGEECVHKFNGMWAFAIWDKQNKELFLARDRLGIKPLHYANYDNTFIFGSEIKSIMAYGIPNDINHEILELYLTLGYIPAPFTFNKHIHKIMPGEYLVIKNGTIHKRKYWDLPDIDEKNMFEDKSRIYEEFEYLLTDAVRLRMRSDVAFGAFLSGGLDSASIVALMSGLSEHPVETFTIGYNEVEYDERKLAKEVADKFQGNYHEKIVEKESFEDSLNKIVFHYDEPFGDSSAIPTGFVSAFASEHVKMVLTGDGGDEVLSGYTGYQGEKFAAQYQKIPYWIRNILPAILDTSTNAFSGGIKYKLNRMRNVLNASNKDFFQRLITKFAWTKSNLLQELLSGYKNLYKIEDYIQDFYRQCTYQDNFYRLMYFNLKLSLPDDMLVKVDRMSMAHSLEARIPFLDYRLVEFMVQVDKNIKMQGYQRKSVLLNSIGKRLPSSLLKSPKKGFRVPVREWFKDRDFQHQLTKLLNSNNWRLNKKALENIFDLNLKGKEDFGNFIWMLFVLERHLERCNTNFFVDNPVIN